METISRTLLTFLLNALWQVPLAWAVAALACRLMPNGPARHRHAVWVAALCAAFLLPSLSVRAPQRPAVITAAPAAAPIAAAIAAPPVPTTAIPSTAPSPSAPSVFFSHDWAMLLLGAYALFLAVRLAQFLRALYRAFEIRRDAAAGGLPALLQRCQDAFSTGGVQLLRSADITGPVALHRAILLPDAMFDEPREDVLATAVGHEMAHIARHDFLLKLLYELLYLPLSFHPAAIFIHRGIENSREMACDELVTRHLLEPAVYARSIVAIAGAAAPLQHAGYVLGVFDGDILEERIRSLMERRGGDLRRARIALAGALALLAVCLVFAGGLSVHAQTAVQSEMQAAADAFNHGNFQGAAEHFENAAKLDPANLKVKLFLANAYVRQSLAEGQYLPRNADDTPLLNAALRQYHEVLQLDSRNATAMFGIVSLNMPAEVDESRQLMLKLIADDPGNKDAYYALAVMDWGIAYGQIHAALQSLGSSPAVMQVPDAAVRATVRTRVGPYLEEGFRMAQIALEKEPANDMVMAYLNLLHRAKGLLTDDPKEAAAEHAKADQWVGKALGARRAKANQPKPADAINLDGEPPVVVPAPPPPPPPPPPGTAPKPRNPNEGGR